MRPTDFIDAFETFIRDNANKIDALNLVVTRPRDLTRDSLRELRMALDARHFTENALRTAWHDKTNEDIAASIIGFIRQAASAEVEQICLLTDQLHALLVEIGARDEQQDALALEPWSQTAA